MIGNGRKEFVAKEDMKLIMFCVDKMKFLRYLGINENGAVNKTTIMRDFVAGGPIAA